MDKSIKRTVLWAHLEKIFFAISIYCKTLSFEQSGQDYVIRKYIPLSPFPFPCVKCGAQTMMDIIDKIRISYVYFNQEGNPRITQITILGFYLFSFMAKNQFHTLFHFNHAFFTVMKKIKPVLIYCELRKW